MNRKPGAWASALIIAAMLGLSAYAWNTLPPDARIPAHWNVARKVDGFGSKLEG